MIGAVHVDDGVLRKPRELRARVRDDGGNETQQRVSLRPSGSVELSVVRHHIGERIRHGIDPEGATVHLIVARHAAATGESRLSESGVTSPR